LLSGDDLVAVLAPHQQRGRGHLLVIPVAHRVTILELTTDEQAAVMNTVVRASEALIGAFDPEGIAV
jgi:histidine triad (HIT) family protein